MSLLMKPEPPSRTPSRAVGDRHRPRLLEEEQDAAVERVEVRNLNARPLPQSGDVFVQRSHVRGVQQSSTQRTRVGIAQRPRHLRLLHIIHPVYIEGTNRLMAVSR